MFFFETWRRKNTGNYRCQETKGFIIRCAWLRIRDAEEYVAVTTAQNCVWTGLCLNIRWESGWWHWRLKWHNSAPLGKFWDIVTKWYHFVFPNPSQFVIDQWPEHWTLILTLFINAHRSETSVDGIYRVIHKSLRDFRTPLRNNQDRHGRKGHINR